MSGAVVDAVPDPVMFVDRYWTPKGVGIVDARPNVVAVTPDPVDAIW
jgi:hypothetical protein